MNFKRSIKILCIFSMILLFVQCEKKEMFLTEGNQPDAAQNLKVKKPKPDKPDKPASEAENVIITGDVTGTGLASTSVREFLPFTLTISDHFNHDGLIEEGTFEGTIRILYSTKRKGENWIDFYYTDNNNYEKYIVIRQANPNDAYNPVERIMTLDNAYVFLRNKTLDINWDGYCTASATVNFSDPDPD